VDGDKGKWQLLPEGIQFFKNIRNELCVVAIAGLYRTGKSYIMNVLAGVNAGEIPEQVPKIFELGHTVEGCTRGVWAFRIPHFTDKKLKILFCWILKECTTRLARD
jgi:hypothetical protein